MAKKSMIAVLYVFGIAVLGACGDAGTLGVDLPQGGGTSFPTDPIESQIDPTAPSGAPAPPSEEPEPSSDDPQPNPHGPTGFDVAENMTMFVFDDGPVGEDGLPAYGNSFVTQGYLYPFGFLVHHEGTNADGTPAYPELVIGIWTCRGQFIGDGANTTTGPWVVSTQLYDFFETPGFDPNKASGEHNLVSEGYELADLNKPGQRAITGATGLPSEAGEELQQQLVGFNESGGVNLRIVIPQGFEPVIDYQDLPMDSIAQIDRARCVFDLVDGLVCPDA